MEVHDTSGLDAFDMCQVPGMLIPQKFNVPDFKKYKGMRCPHTHLRAYCRKMAAYYDNDKLLIHYFLDNLSGASLEWYMELERSHVQTQRDLDKCFLKHYQYNIYMSPNCTQYQNLSLRSSESFKEYAQRLRELVVRVQPPLLDKQLVDMFMGTLRSPYVDKMISSVST